MNYTGLQNGIKKAKKRVLKVDYQQIANLYQAFPVHFKCIMDNYERDLKIARKTTKQHPNYKFRTQSASTLRRLMQYSIDGDL